MSKTLPQLTVASTLTVSDELLVNADSGNPRRATLGALAGLVFAAATVAGISGGGTTNFLRADGEWAVAGTGDVVGPAAAVNERLAVYDGTTGKLLKDGGMTIAGILAYVDTQVGNLVASAPGALDTLNELAAALGDDANFAGTVTTSLATKVVGPAAAADNALARFDGTTGKLLQNSAGATLSDTAGLTLASGALTSNAPGLTITQTWNAGAVAFTGILGNFTDTASAAGSLLMDLQVGGASKAYIKKSGHIVSVSGGGFIAIGSAQFVATASTEGNARAVLSSGGLTLASSAKIQFSDSSNTSIDSGSLLLDAANIYAFRNGANAQALRIYNTYTDASNYERGGLKWDTNTLFLSTEKGGTGTDRAIRVEASSAGGGVTLASGGASRLWASSNGIEVYAVLRPSPSNAIDLGLSGSRTWRNLFMDGYQELAETTAPSAPVADKVRIYAADNGAGKTALYALFATGAAQQIAVQP